MRKVLEDLHTPLYQFMVLCELIDMAKVKKRKTRAEIQRAYRQRLQENDPEAARENERRRWYRRRASKKVQGIEDMSERNRRIIRKKWRTQKAEYRRRIKRNQQTMTPPSSDGSEIVEKPRRGRPKLDYRRTKAYRELNRLSESLTTVTNSREKYKQRWLRLKMKITNPRAKNASLATEGSSSTVISCSPLSEKSCAESSNSVSLGTSSVHGNALDGDTKRLIADFFERDDNSRLTTGKKQTVTKFKVRKQKRLLCDSMQNLHEKFCAEYPSSVISYVTFTRHRPFWIVQATNKDRDTCLCKKHENIQLCADKLHQLGVLKIKRCEEVLDHVCCSLDRRQCMLRDCDSCYENVVQYNQSGMPNDEAVVVWSQWTTVNQEYEKEGKAKTAKVTKKLVKRGTLKELKSSFSDSVKTVLAPHVYKIRHQFRAYRHLKETLDVNEVVIHIDFSENYQCKHAAEIQSAHFGASNEQATLHTGVMYKVDGLQSFTTISNSLRHDAAAIWAYMQPVLDNLRATNPEITDLHFFSDGPTTQYRNKQNFFLFSTVLHEMGFECGSWNFFESGHGKGSPDAVGGSLKRKADAVVNAGCDLPNATSLYDVLCKDSVIRLYFVNDSEVQQFDNRCSSSLKAVAGTMKLHQVITDEPHCIAFRNLSCFCMRPTVCSCYSLQRRKFPAPEIHEVSS